MLVVAAFVVVIHLLGRQPKAPSLRQRKTSDIKDVEDEIISERHVGELISADDIYQGIYEKDGVYYALARLSGTNFSVMPGPDQDARESTLIEILGQVDYPVQFITTTVVSDTTEAARKIAERAAGITDNPRLQSYCFLYAGALQQMKLERKVLAQQSWMVLSSHGIEGKNTDPVEKLRERMTLLAANLRDKARIFITPVVRSEEVMDALQQIVLPEAIVKPSERALAGVTEPIHFMEGEMQRVQKAG
ncbi:MAG TPA: hypothetical protein GXX25_13265 [Desulfotomaculum sp.]|nr:hypothetical protein [Desulfotomaculum sp.]